MRKLIGYVILIFVLAVSAYILSYFMFDIDKTCESAYGEDYHLFISPIPDAWCKSIHGEMKLFP